MSRWWWKLLLTPAERSAEHTAAWMRMTPRHVRVRPLRGDNLKAAVARVREHYADLKGKDGKARVDVVSEKPLTVRVTVGDASTDLRVAMFRPNPKRKP